MGSNNNTIKQTQVARLGDALMEIKEDVMPEDRAGACKKFKVTAGTISRYLNGEARDAIRAENFLSYFKARIAEREKALQ